MNVACYDNIVKYRLVHGFLVYETMNVLGGERIISPFKSSTINSCISPSVARFAILCLSNKSLLIFD